jgi:hypothetical protein
VTVGVDAGDPTARLVAALQVHGCAEAFETPTRLVEVVDVRAEPVGVVEVAHGELTCSRYMTRPYDFEWA